MNKRGALVFFVKKPIIYKPGIILNCEYDFPAEIFIEFHCSLVNYGVNDGFCVCFYWYEMKPNDTSAMPSHAYNWSNSLTEQIAKSSFLHNT